LMLAARPLENGALSCRLLSCNALQLLPYRATSTASPAADASGKAPGTRLEDSLGQRISLSGDGRVLELEVPAQKLRIARSDEHPEPSVPQRPERARGGPPLDVVQVEIRHDDVVLAGEIGAPPGAHGRLPAVFFISGSGLQDRDGLSSGIDLG